MQKAVLAGLAVLSFSLLPRWAFTQDLSDLSASHVEMTEIASSVQGKSVSVAFYGNVRDRDFTGTLFDIRTDGSDLKGKIRFESNRGWGEWHNLRIFERLYSADAVAAFRGSVVRSGGFEIELQAEGATRIILDRAATFDSRLDSDRQRVIWAESGTRAAASTGNVRAPRLITREEWGARDFDGTPQPLAQPSYDKITFHHAACCGAYSYQDGVAQVQWIQEFHQDGRGWSDIGYHFVMDQSGRLYQGRPFMDSGVALEDGPTLAQGAHVGGYNRGNIGISVLGCYHPPEGSGCTDVLSPSALDSLINAIAFLSERYQVPSSEIFGHRDFSSTACPGDNNYRLLPDIRTQVEDIKRFGSLPVVSAYTLSEIYPNPTAENATVRYFMDTEGIVTLTLHDALGRLLQVVDEGFRDENRWNTVELYTEDLPPGVYFVRLTVGGFASMAFTATQPLVIAQ